jgi:antitoxin component YwqK of YwqJK toxin-antitoxin module
MEILLSALKLENGNNVNIDNFKNRVFYFGTHFTGTAIELNSFGGIKRSIEYIDGKIFGKHKLYFEGTDQVKREISYENSIPHGTYKQYYPNNQVETIGEMNHGKTEGQVIWYWENGQIKDLSYFVADLEQGEHIAYHLNGQLKVKYNVINNLREGRSIEYYENGSVKRIIEIKKGSIIDGALTTYWNNGNCFFIENYLNGKLDGERKIFLKDGALEKTQLYENGILTWDSEEENDQELSDFIINNM